jgi:hypothetical protein
MTQNEIKSELLRILAKIDGQIIGAWGDTLEHTTEAVILEDSGQISYNFWLHDLQNLFKRLDNTGPIGDNEGEKYARKCSKCGKGMNEGFIIGNGDEYFCGENCLYQIYSADEWELMADDDETDEAFNYWTEWEDEGEYQYQIINGVLEEIDQ